MRLDIFQTSITLLLVQKAILINTRLPEYCPQGALGHVTRVIGNRRVPMSTQVEPDFVTPGGLSIKLKTELFEPPDNIPITESAQSPHQNPTING